MGFGSVLSRNDKIKVSFKNLNRTFLGYQFHGPKLVRECEDWFKMSLYPEHPVRDLGTSYTRLISMYTLGGVNSESFSKFSWSYVSMYQDYMINMTVKPSKSVKRIFKYVLRKNFKELIVPVVNPRLLDIFAILDCFRLTDCRKTNIGGVT